MTLFISPLVCSFVSYHSIVQVYKYVIFVLSHANHHEWAVIRALDSTANNLCVHLAFLISKFNSNVTFFLAS